MNKLHSKVQVLLMATRLLIVISRKYVGSPSIFSFIWYKRWSSVRKYLDLGTSVLRYG